MKEFPEEISQRIQFEQFVQKFLKDHEQPKPADIERFIQEIKILEKFSLDSKRYYVLFDHSKFCPVYTSANLVKEGHSIEYILEQGLFFLPKIIHWKQLLIPVKIIFWAKRFEKMINRPLVGKNTEAYCCGIKLKDKWNKWRTIMFRQRVLSATKEKKALLSFFEVDEITAIYKADFTWYKISFADKDIQTSRVYFSKGSNKEQVDLLSPRELEILQLAKINKSNQEIALLLNISKNTVERHRKNMIARVGVKDMTTLIRICQLAKVK